MAYSLAQNRETAERVTQKIFVHGEDVSKFVSRWAAETGASVPNLPENLGWLLGKIKAGEGQKISDLFSLYFTGTGAGRVGLTTLNSILSEMKDANLSSIDATALRRFMEYNEGESSQGRRLSETASSNFQIYHALKIAEGEIVPSRRGQGGGAALTQGGAQSRQGGAEDGQEPQGIPRAAGARAQMPEFDSSSLERTQNEMYSAYKKMNSEWSDAMSSKWNIIKEGIIAPKESKERYALSAQFSKVTSNFTMLTSRYVALRSTINNGNVALFGAAMGEYFSMLEQYVSSLRDLQQMTSNYDARSGMKLVGASIDLALEAAMVVPLAGGIMRLAGTGTSAAMRGLGGMGKADWIASGVSTLVFGSALTGKEIAETRAVNNALANFEKDQAGTIHNLRLMLLEWKKQLAPVPASSSLVQQIDDTMSKLADIEYALKRRESVSAKDVALLFAQVAVLSIGVSAIRPARATVQPAPAPKSPVIANRQIVPTEADLAISPSPAPADVANPTRWQKIKTGAKEKAVKIKDATKAATQKITAATKEKAQGLRERWQQRRAAKGAAEEPAVAETAPEAAPARQSKLRHPVRAFNDWRASRAEAKGSNAPAESESVSPADGEVQAPGKARRAKDAAGAALKKGVKKGKEIAADVGEYLAPKDISKYVTKGEDGTFTFPRPKEVYILGKEGSLKRPSSKKAYELKAGDQIKIRMRTCTLQEDGTFKPEESISLSSASSTKTIRGGFPFGLKNFGTLEKTTDGLKFTNNKRLVDILIQTKEGEEISVPRGDSHIIQDGDRIYTGRYLHLKSYVYEDGNWHVEIAGRRVLYRDHEI
ncbi:Uncharacterised protein [Candidatus Anstonella stagnisolia]|nr:Uncharacterised protein [Candidatus Anstonella stagnisolia]